MFLPSNQRSQTLWSFAGDNAREQSVGQKQGFNICTDLRQEFGGLALGRIAEEYCPKTDAAEDRFFQNSSAFDCVVTIRSELAARECPTQFLHQRMMFAFNGTKAME